MTIFSETAYPDIRDPRVMVGVPPARRAAMTSLWALAERLTKLIIDAREPMIGQIKLAWWRDMMVMLARDPDALPKGEPLLGELQATWGGQGGLEALVDAAEHVLLADDADGRRDGATAFGDTLFHLSGGAEALGRRWGLLWAATVQDDEAAARSLLADARGCRPGERALFARQKPLLMLDRWAGAIARVDGERHWRSEGLLLLRVGLFGR